jgi:hypothetical protein
MVPRRRIAEATLRGRTRFIRVTAGRRSLLAGAVVALALLLSALLGGASAVASRQSHKPVAALRLRLAFRRVVTLNPVSELLSTGGGSPEIRGGIFHRMM